MMYDICDSPVSLTSQAQLDDWNGVVHGVLSHGTKPGVHLGALIDANPDFAMGHAARGLFMIMTGRKEMLTHAINAAKTSKQKLKVHGGNTREQGWVTALDQWLNDQPTRAIETMEKILRENPRDTISAKLSHGIRFILGDGNGMRRSVERVLGAHGSDHAMRGYILGCHAFTLEETGEYAAAERTGLQGLQYATDDAWGLHAVAHVYDMTANPDAGIQLIEDNGAAWGHCNNFTYHVWWHKALLHLDRGELDVALALYDTKIRQDKTDDYRDIANATSLLMRLELEGMDVANRWDELADFSENRTEDSCLVFADLHYMLALAGANRPDAKAEMMARFACDAIQSGDMAQRFKDPGMAAMAGLNAFSEGRYTDAFVNLAAARPSMQTIGGSHAQRDVFERMTIDAGLRAGGVDQVETFLSERLSQRAGHEDRFTATRFASLADARRIPAQ
jgi:tetratricopeptide (TPR) repeat protein